MQINRTTAWVLVVVFLAGWYVSSARRPEPVPEPLTNRPVVRWVARAAKAMLWVLVFAEEKPPLEEKPTGVDEPVRLVKSPEDGSRRVDWSEGW